MQISDLESLKNEIEKSRNVVIYGTGMIGKLLYHWLTKTIEKRDFYICVSKLKTGEEQLLGHRVYEFETIKKTLNSALVVIATKNPTNQAIWSQIKENKQYEYALLSEKTISQLYDSDITYSLLCENQIETNRRIEELTGTVYKLYYETQEKYIQHMPQVSLNFEVHLVEHCNLNCKNCDHFSPIADCEMVDSSMLRKDFERIAFLSKGNIGVIQLLGGEPLLHPEIENIIKMAREIFSGAEIVIVSNGILLNKMPESFWESCSENKIKISVTKYPIELDFDLMSIKARKFGVEFSFYGKAEVCKTLWHLPIDENGKQNPIINSLHCQRFNRCVILAKGRIFPCIIPANIRHFNKYFKKDIPVSELDYIDIYKVETMKEITEFISKPFPFCKYCNVMGETSGHDWERSNKDLSEWT